MNPILTTTTITTRLAPLVAVLGLGLLLSACDSDALETASAQAGLAKGSEILPAAQATSIQTSDTSQVSFGQSSSIAQVDQTGVLQSTPQVAAAAAAAADIDGSVPVPAPAAQSIVTSAPTPVQPMGRVSLSWTPPTENTDGSALANLAGYRVYFGSNPASLSQMVEIASPGLTAYVLENLPSGKIYFAIAAYSSAGAESSLSGVASQTI